MSGLSDAGERERGRGLAVLTYHSLAPGSSVIGTDPSWFTATLDALDAAGFHPVDLADWVARGRPDEPNGYALTFDDGLASILDAVDLLTSRRVPATVFVVTDFVGKDNGWRGQLRGVPRERLLDWSELADLARTGFHIGAHTKTHIPLIGCDPAQLDDELRGARDAVEDQIGQPCPLLAYPYGLRSPKVVQAAARYYAAGFGTTLSHATDRQDLFDLARIDSYYLRTHATLNALVNDRWRGTLRWRRWLRTLRQGLNRPARHDGRAA